MLAEHPNRAEEIDVKAATASLKDYWATYAGQSGYENYSDQTFLDDALYGIAIAIDKEKFEGAKGYDFFKQALLNFLNNSTNK